MTQAQPEDQPRNAEADGQATRPGSSAAPGTKPQEHGHGGADLGGRLDQFGTILAKGLDLAEAGVSLGVTILSRVGAAAQQQLRERMDGAMPPSTGPVPGQAPASGAGPADASGEPAPARSPEPAYGITNRVPLLPGGPVQISFAINNDSMTEPKKVEVRVEGFTGDAHGTRINGGLFKVRPAQKTIAPVDFEKFFLNGTVPSDAPPDVYRGWVVVTSDTELRIPVLLVTTPL